ncbi:MAG TPA: helix-turn-helix domain-containing protein [bacterium]|jgi:predicted transcriptional regulator
MKGKGYFEQLADRRKRGVELYKKGWYQHEITEVLGVTQPSVSKWVRAEAAGGAGQSSAAWERQEDLAGRSRRSRQIVAEKSA